jgi:hypothetical protein
MEKCMYWKTQFNVVAGHSWGTLPQRLQNEWESIDCDNFIIIPSAECTLVDGEPTRCKLTVQALFYFGY